MIFVDIFIRIIGVISLILLLTGYSRAQDWEYIDWMAIGVWIWHEYEIRKRKVSEKDGDDKS
jgi:hypothetical protein